MLALLLAVAAAALGGEPDQVLVTYQAVGASRISGASQTMHWAATQLGGGKARVEVRVPIDSFASGDASFDSMIRAALQSDRYPFAEVEGVAGPSGFEGTLALHGVQRTLHMPVTFVHSGGQLLVDTSFPLDLQQFGAAVPSGASQLSIHFAARLSVNPAAVLGGGTLGSN